MLSSSSIGAVGLQV